LRVVILIVFFFSSLFSCSSNSLKFSSNEYDFGKVLSDSSFFYSVRITNVIKNTVKITDVRATCGCTVPMVENKVLKPGMETKLKIQFDSGSFRGVQRKFVYIFTDKGEKYRIAFNAFVVGKYEMQPEYIKLKEADFPFSKNIKIKSNAGKKDFKVEKVDSQNGINCSLSSSLSFKVVIDDSSSLKHENDVVLYIKGEKNPLVYKIFFEKQSSVKLIPKTIPFLNIKRDKSVTKSATIFSENLVSVNSVKPSVDWIKFLETKEFNGRFVLYFSTIPSKMTKGFGKSYITISVKDKQGKVERIKWPVIYNVF